MKKNVLNLSLLMLLSTSFNAFGMDGQKSEGWKKFFYMFSPSTTTAAPEECVNSADEVLKTSSDALQSAIQVVQNSSNPDSGQVQTVVNSALAAIENVNNVSQDAKFGALLQIRNDIVKLGQLLQGGLEIVYNKAIDNLPAIKTLVSSHPKISLAVGATVASAGSYAIYQYLSNKGMAAQSNDLRSLSVQADEDSKDLASNDEDVDINNFVKSLDPKNGEDYKKFVDYLITNNQENNLLNYNHVDNDGRTLLMLLAENYWPAGFVTTNYPALAYFKESMDHNNKEIDVNQKDNHGRTALFYAAHYGLENIVNFLLDELDANVDSIEIGAANFKEGYGVDESTYDRIKDKLILYKQQQFLSLN